ncbi:Protein of unknown function [Gryllus bimaculatus]|nr:Protein of unknown function [Gryllus bimaculatus]
MHWGSPPSAVSLRLRLRFRAAAAAAPRHLTCGRYEPLPGRSSSLPTGCQEISAPSILLGRMYRSSADFQLLPSSVPAASVYLIRSAQHTNIILPQSKDVLYFV